MTHLCKGEDVGGGAGLGCDGRALLLDGRAVGHEGGPGKGHAPPPATVAPRGVQGTSVHRPVQAKNSISFTLSLININSPAENKFKLSTIFIFYYIIYNLIIVNSNKKYKKYHIFRLEQI